MRIFRRSCGVVALAAGMAAAGAGPTCAQTALAQPGALGLYVGEQALRDLTQSAQPPFAMVDLPAPDAPPREGGQFGTVSIPFSNLAFKDAWLRIADAAAGTAAAECRGDQACAARLVRIRAGLAEAASADLHRKLEIVNTLVNAEIAYRSDRQTYGRADYWATPAETLQRGAGDCEDIAGLKRALLLDLGLDETSLTMIVLQDTRRNLFHAVLAVETEEGAYILDNIRDPVVSDALIPDYLPLFSFSSASSWIHGLPQGSPHVVQPLTASTTIAAPGEAVMAEDSRTPSVQDRLDQLNRSVITG